EATIEDMLRQYGRQFHASQGATVVMEPTGLVRAIVGGRDYGQSQFNRATDAARQPGSSFKPFIYLSAVMTDRYHRDSMVNGASLCIGNWCPNNYGGASAGMMPMNVALQKSLNTVAVWLTIKIGEHYWPKGQPYHLGRIAQIGRNKIVETARAMGVVNTPLTDTVSLPLGAAEVKMMDMASAYAVFANGGTDFAPIIEGLVQMKGRGEPAPNFITVPHENVAMAMAQGYSKVSGEASCVMVHVNVGTANTICGLMNAARDNVPVLLAAGRTPLTETGHIGSRDAPRPAHQHHRLPRHRHRHERAARPGLSLLAARGAGR
ncbi:MAG: hypothetical protein EBT34_14945, partial [Acetobacteraceae bacterium]|nr:hypothetical protein [Acetobacteraceae bacterium]